MIFADFFYFMLTESLGVSLSPSATQPSITQGDRPSKKSP